MIADALNCEIRAYVARMREVNPLFSKAEAGALTTSTMSLYLANIRYLIGHTVPFLGRARELAANAGDVALAAHYGHKLAEETGHEQWAEDDLARMRQHGATATAEVLPAMRALVQFTSRIIDEDPVLYLAYILQTEQIISEIGPEWLRLLEERCGIPRQCVSVVDHHAELDREHTDEALELIDELVGDPRKLPRMREVVVESIALFQRFCEELTAGAEDARSMDHASVAAA
jgi:pyrroloquinoline quinone (PQQ) biosynthesis protein C